MADNISNIIDPQVFTDVDKLIASIKEVENEITIINGKALSVNVDIKGAESLNALAAAMEKQQVLLDGLQETYKNNVAVTNEVNAANKNLGVTIGATANDIGNLENRLAGLNILLSQATKGSEGYRNLQTQIAKASSELDTMKPKIQQVNTELGTTNIQVNKVNTSFTVMGVNVDNVLARMTIRMIAMQLVFVPIIAGITAMITYFMAASKAAKEYDDALKDIQDSIKGNALGDQQKAQELISIARDQSTAMHLRIDAVKELQDLYPNYFKQLSQEAILTGDITKQTKELNEALLNKAIMEANYDKAKLAAKKYSDAEDKKEDAEGRITKYTNQVNEYNKEVENYNKNRGMQPIAGFGIESKFRLQSAQSDKSESQKQMDEAQAEINKYNGIANQFAVKAAPTLVKDPKDKSGTGRQTSNPIKSTADVSEINNEIAAEKERAEVQHEIWQNEKADIGERLQANAQYYSLLSGIAALEKQKADEETRNKQKNAQQDISGYESKISDIQSGKTKFKDPQAEIKTLRDNITEKQKVIDDGNIDLNTHQTTFDNAYIKLANESGKNVLSIYKSVQDQQLEAQKEALTAELSAIEDKAIQEEEINKAAYDKQEITAEEHNRRLKKIKKQAEDDETAAAIKHYEEMLLTVDLSNGVEELLNDNIRQLKKKQLGEIDTTSKKEQPTGALPELEAAVDTSKKDASLFEGGQLQQNLTEIDHFATQGIEIYTTFYDAIKQMRDNAFAAEQQQLEIQMRSVTLQAQQKQAAILGTTNFQVTKTNQLATLAAQTAAQQNELQTKENSLALKKAKADKQAAEMTVILKTAEGIATALPLLGNPGTIALGIIEIALITAMGAAQYAAAASTPLPQFFTGGTTSTPYFIAGEKGRELMTFPSGEQRIADKPGIYNAPIGTKIDPNHITEMMINNASSTLGMSVYDMYKFKGSDMTDERIVKKLDDVENTLVDIHRASSRNQPTIIKVESSNKLLVWSKKQK